MRHPLPCKVTADLNRYIFAVDRAKAMDDMQEEFHAEAYSEVWEMLQGRATEEALDLMDGILQELEWESVVEMVFHAFNSSDSSSLRSFLQPAIHKKINEIADGKLEKFLDEEDEKVESY